MTVWPCGAPAAGPRGAAHGVARPRGAGRAAPAGALEP